MLKIFGIVLIVYTLSTIFFNIPSIYDLLPMPGPITEKEDVQYLKVIPTKPTYKAEAIGVALGIVLMLFPIISERNKNGGK